MALVHRAHPLLAVAVEVAGAPLLLWPVLAHTHVMAVSAVQQAVE